MLKRYTFWLTAGILFQFLTAIIHSLSFFVRQKPENDTEQQMLDLLYNYHLDLGAGFHPTFGNLFTALSACFTLMCLLGGFTLGHLLIKHTEPSIMKGIIAINLAIFTVCFIVMAFLTFLPPIVLTGLIVINLFAAYILCPKIEASV
ncbi:MAG: hypothetical protein JO053_04950 [Acidobacteria bacterium]|nr:hypothetical protein [Acidobacteriota bacterium]